jgi:hypothetical protein
VKARESLPLFRWHPRVDYDWAYAGHWDPDAASVFVEVYIEARQPDGEAVGRFIERELVGFGN